MRAQPLINCRDVPASSRWYQRILGCVGGHGGTEYERLWDPSLHSSKWGPDGLILQLHAWEVDHHHGPMGDPTRAVGNGMLLWFEVDDFDAAVALVPTGSNPVGDAASRRGCLATSVALVREIDEGLPCTACSVCGDLLPDTLLEA